MELTNVRSYGDKGALKFVTIRGEDVFVIGATTGIPFGSVNQLVVNITAATTLNPSTHGGAVVYCTTDNIVVTLPANGPSSAGIVYQVQATASDGAMLFQLKTASATDWFQMGGVTAATTNLIAKDVKATQQYGDELSITSNGSTCWFCTNTIGTWTLATST